MTAPMRIVDLFCKAGGASMGYHLAFPDAEIIGVDVEPQPHYPFEFVQMDAFEYVARMNESSAWGWASRRLVRLVHASPPCQDHSTLKTMHTGHGTGWMLAAMIERIRELSVPWVVENVPGSEAGMPGAWTMLCGSSFGLGVRRHRLFASSELLMSLPCRHAEQGAPIGVTGHGAQGHEYKRGVPVADQAARRDAMGIDWMNRDELAQAIPPAYTEWIGNQLKVAA